MPKKNEKEKEKENLSRPSCSWCNIDGLRQTHWFLLCKQKHDIFTDVR